MKWFRSLLLLLPLVTLLLSACCDHEPYQRHAYRLNVLAIGNSYTEIATLYLPDLLREKGDYEVRVCQLIKHSSSLQDHWQNHLSNAAVYRFDAGTWQGWHTVDSVRTLDQALDFARWDIVVLQQVSWLSGNAESYQPSCDSLIALLRRHKVKHQLALHKTWAYSRYSASSDFRPYNYDQPTMDSAISAAAIAIAPKFDIIIPAGDLIRALRATDLNNCMDLTEDGSHLDRGMPALALSLLWYQTLLTPTTRTSALPTSVRSYQGSLPTTPHALTQLQPLIPTTTN